MDNLFQPGTIICNTQSYFPNRMPVWGIVLPKLRFIELFQKEKGPWPKNEVYNYSVENRFGTYLPYEINIVSNPSSYSSEEIRKILPYEHFLNDNKSVGTKCFGEIWSPRLKRQLSLEIMSTTTGHTIPFDLKQLKLIDMIRKYAFLEAGCNPHHSSEVEFDMKCMIEYFSGEFKGKLPESPYVEELIKILRFCYFKEENIFY